MKSTSLASTVVFVVLLDLSPKVLHGGAQQRGLTSPRKVRDVKPIYPPKSLDAGDEGIVIVEFRGDESGAVTETSVVYSKCPSLNDAAMAAVRAWRFEPTTMNGKPVPFTGTAEIPFRLPARLKSRAQRPGACKWVEPPKALH